jgi:16S rRNA (adenine1518-N6/adenine1519-N6)-dimethyltransferase
LCDNPETLVVIGNIPYNITTPIIFHLLNRAWRPADIVLMVQREVADRIIADAGSAAYGALSVGVQSVAHTRRLFNVSRQSFRPVPNVDSSVIRITPHHPPQLSAGMEADLRKLTATAFSWRRKQMQKTLRSSPAYGLDEEDIAELERDTGITLDARPETLSPDQFIALATLLRKLERPLDPD